MTDGEIVRERRVTIAQRRKRLDDPAEQEFLNLRAGAESLVNEMYHKDGEKTKFTESHLRQEPPVIPVSLDGCDSQRRRFNKKRNINRVCQ